MATQMTLNIGNERRDLFTKALDYLGSHGIEVCGVRYVSEKRLQEYGYPIGLLKKYGILDSTAVGAKSDGSKAIFYGINRAVSKAKQSRWVNAAA